MKKYISEEDFPERISIELGPELGPVDIIRLLGEIRESATPQSFGIKKGGGSISSDIVIRKGTVYFCSCDGNFYAVDAETGKEKWRFRAGDVLPAFGMDEDTIYASCFDHNLYAISLEGKLKWKFQTNGKLGNNPCTHNGKVYFSCEDGNLYCVDKAGRLVWRYSTESPSCAIPVVHNGLVFFGNFDGNFYALNAETGRLAWRYRCNSATGGCTVKDDTILLPCINKTLYAFSPDGRLLWTYKSKDNLPPNIITSLYKNMIFIGTRGKSILAINIKTGKLVWEFNTQEMNFSYSVVKDGILYFGSCDNNFYALNADTGRKIWSFATNAPNFGGSIYRDKIYFGSWDCHVYCLDRKTGKLVWKFQTSTGRMSNYEVDRRMDKQELEVMVELPETSKDRKKPEDEVTIADYGEFSGTYIDVTKSDYLGIKKKGYVKGKGI